MKNEILKILNENPKGMRQREIAGMLGIWLCDKEFLNSISELKTSGEIYFINHIDFANAEFYNIWFRSE